MELIEAYIEKRRKRTEERTKQIKKMEDMIKEYINKLVKDHFEKTRFDKNPYRWNDDSDKYLFINWNTNKNPIIIKESENNWPLKYVLW